MRLSTCTLGGCLAALVATAVVLAAQPPAQAQSCKPLAMTYVLHDGQKQNVHICGPTWAGIKAEQIGLGQASPGDKLGDPIARSLVRFVCIRQCPATLPTEPAKVDTVVWKGELRTRGRLEVRCESTRCEVFQGGKQMYYPRDPSAPSAWDHVSYVELASEESR
jgi:hypothetical protein